MGVFDKKRKAVTVDTRWRRAWPEVRPMRWWIEVGRRVKARRLAHRDLERVRQVCAEVEREWKSKTRKD
jgi:hypothetical protein